MSQENKWTPGPWRVDDDGVDYPLIIGNDEKYVCEILFHPQPSQQVANAHLIAAAPDLYEALETAESCIVDVVGAFGVKVPDEILQEIRAALAKARGEA